MKFRGFSHIGALVGMSLFVVLRFSIEVQAVESLEAKATRIHNDVLTVDTHVDTPMRITRRDFDIGQRHDARKGGGRVDLPRMKEGGLDAIFFAVYLGQGERNAEANERAKKRALGVFEAIHKSIAEHPDLAGIALTPDDASRLEAEGKRAIFIGIENGYAVGKDLSMVEKYFDLGARYITLCHSSNNDICDSSTDRKGVEHHGLSEFGVSVVKEMNRLGMMVDISHASDETFYDVIKLSRAPIIASHSSVRTICDNRRNLDDGMLRALAKNGGVIQICILGAYIRAPEPNPERDNAIAELRATYDDFGSLSDERKDEVRQKWFAITDKYPSSQANVSDVVDHIDHVVKLVGIDHVGIGTDFDGGGGIKGCYDVSEMGNITLELVKRGYNEAQIRKIWGGNTMRVFREVEQVAREQ